MRTRTEKALATRIKHRLEDQGKYCLTPLAICAWEIPGGQFGKSWVWCLNQPLGIPMQHSRDTRWDEWRKGQVIDIRQLRLPL